MDSSEKFCLKWNDFRNNLTSSFSEQRENPDFTDVTLACDDQGQLTAHRFILAASSSFFRDILSKQKHPNLLIYMRGIKSKDLNCILDFIYHGEVNIYQEDLEGFLAIAEELGLKGLTGTSSEETVQPEENKYAVKRVKTVKPNDYFINTDIVHKFNFKDPKDTKFDTSSFLVVTDISVDYKELDEQISTMMEKREGVWTCKMCGKTDERLNKKQNIQYHVESVHIDGGAHPCSRVGKYLGLEIV